MDFRFSQDQLDFRESVKTFLASECTSGHLRKLVDTETQRDTSRWNKLAELGLTGFFVPENLGGLGLNEVDFVLIAEACGAAALPETLVEQAAVIAPLLTACPASKARDEILTSFAKGATQLAVQMSSSSLTNDMHVADVLVFPGDKTSVMSARREEVGVAVLSSIDPLRCLFEVNVDGGQCLATDGGELWAHTFERGALFASAQLVGLAQAMVDMTVAYAQQRTQFGKPIGSFQAVKHHLASAQVAVSFAQPVVYRAAYEVAHDTTAQSVAVSHGKIAAGDAAMTASKAAIQCHGAMGYTFEVDLHLWMKRAWALIGAWGDRDFHINRVSEFAFGAGRTFGALDKAG
jgi:alkylation response protein AidB-like acyl-CoA dehydrogenase